MRRAAVCGTHKTGAPRVGGDGLSDCSYPCSVLVCYKIYIISTECLLFKIEK